MTAGGNGHFSGRRNREQVGAGKSQRAGVYASQAHGEQLERISFPSRAINHGLTIRRKSGGPDVTLVESQYLKGWRRSRWSLPKVMARSHANDCDNYRGQAGHQTRTIRRNRLNHGSRRSLAGTGKCVQVEPQVARRLQPLLRILLKAV